MENRDIVLSVILSIITCGIYKLYWVYKVSSELENEGQTGGLDGAIILLLCIFTGSIGFLLFAMYADANVNAIKARRGLPVVDNKAVWMILGFMIPIVLIPLVQSEINNLASAV